MPNRPGGKRPKRACAVCNHPERRKIDLELAEGAPLVAVASAWRIDGWEMHRHRSQHIRQQMLLAQQMRDAEHGKAVLDRAEWLYGKAVSVITRAERRHDTAVDTMLPDLDPEQRVLVQMAAETMAACDDRVLRAVREARPSLEMIGKLMGDLRQDVVVNLHVSAEFQALRALLLDALRRFPEAQQAVLGALNRYLAGRGAPISGKMSVSAPDSSAFLPLADNVSRETSHDGTAD